MPCGRYGSRVVDVDDVDGRSEHVWIEFHEAFLTFRPTSNSLPMRVKYVTRGATNDDAQT